MSKYQFQQSDIDQSGADLPINPRLGIRGLAKALTALNQQAVLEYTPIIESILCARSQDAEHIEHTFDGLLSFCSYAPALVLFKKLCRHYWEIDPNATAFHINAYRDMWDSDTRAAENKDAPIINLSDGGSS